MAKLVSASKARNEFAEIINRVAYGGETVLVHRRKKPVAAIIPIDDPELLDRIEDELDIRAARRARKEKRSIPWEKIKKDLGL